MKADEKPIKDSLVQTINDFETSPDASARTMRRLASEAPAVFASVGIALLETISETAGYRYMAVLLIRQPALLQQLSDPIAFTRAKALTLSRRLMSVDPTLDIRFAQQLPGRTGPASRDALQGAAVERTLDILDEISLGRRVVTILNHLTHHSDSKISSKATLLIGKRVQNISWTRRIITERNDGRVKANAIESVWGLNTPEVTTLFRECLEDENNRVVGNSIVGLHLAGDPDVLETVRKFATDNKPDFRMTAAWTMGKIGDPELIAALAPLMKDAHPGVRRATLRSLQNIRQIEKQRKSPEPIPEAEAAALLGSEEGPDPDAPTPEGERMDPSECTVDLRLDGSKHPVTPPPNSA